MPIYHDIFREIRLESLSPDPSPQDKIRQKYLRALQNLTQRDVILYASSFTTARRSIDLPVVIFQPDIHKGIYVGAEGS